VNAARTPVVNGSTSVTMEIRRLMSADAAGYRELMLEGYELHPEAFTASVAEREPFPMTWWEGRVKDGDDAEEIVVGAFDEGRLVGVAGLRFEQRPKLRHKSTLYGMYVHREYTKRGLGQRLVEVVLEEARERAGQRIVQLTVTEGNREAESLYAKCGFVTFGVEPFAIAVDGGYAVKIHMWLDLQERPLPPDA